MLVFEADQHQGALPALSLLVPDWRSQYQTLMKYDIQSEAWLSFLCINLWWPVIAPVPRKKSGVMKLVGQSLLWHECIYHALFILNVNFIPFPIKSEYSSVHIVWSLSLSWVWIHMDMWLRILRRYLIWGVEVSQHPEALWGRCTFWPTYYKKVMVVR